MRFMMLMIPKGYESVAPGTAPEAGRPFLSRTLRGEAFAGARTSLRALPRRPALAAARASPRIPQRPAAARRGYFNSLLEAMQRR